MLFEHRMSSEWYQIIIGVPEGYRNPRGELMGHMGLSGEREGLLGQAATPPPLVRIGLGKGGGAPLSFSLSFLSSHFPCWAL